MSFQLQVLDGSLHQLCQCQDAKAYVAGEASFPNLGFSFEFSMVILSITRSIIWHFLCSSILVPLVPTACLLAQLEPPLSHSQHLTLKFAHIEAASHHMKLVVLSPSPRHKEFVRKDSIMVLSKAPAACNDVGECLRV